MSTAWQRTEPSGQRFVRAATVVLAVATLLVGVSASVASADDHSGPSGAPTTGNPASTRTGDGYHQHADAGGETDVNVCSYATPVGVAHCNARVRIDAFAQQLGSALKAQGVSPTSVPSSQGYAPADLQAAYNTVAASAANGAGLTVAIVDAYDDPSAAANLATYRANTGLPPIGVYPCGSGPCFQKVDQNGGTAYPAADAGWAEEISLDVDMVSAMCPLCNILLVEASSNSFANLGTAVNRAATMGAIAISNSYGGSESSFETSWDSSYFNHPGVAITASSGDSGYGVEYPAASENVTAVGGTSLKRSGSAFSETAWSGAGSGCSAYESKPSWQHDTGCTRRTVADVSAVADPATGVWVYDTYGGDPGWEIFGGTSVSSPIIASVFALGYGGATANQPASYPYANVGSLHDVVGGSNGSCGGSYLCTALAGYDGPTGLGTPNSTSAFVAPPTTPDFSINAAPATLTLNAGASNPNASTISLAALNGFSGPVTLSASVNPASGLTPSTPSAPVSLSTTATASLGLTASPTATPGTYPVTVTATSGAVVHTATVTVTVPTPNFSISVAPTSRSVTRGGSATYTITISRTGGFTGAVSLGVTGQTTRDTATFSPNPIGGSATTSVLTVKTSTLDSRGTRTLTIKGTSGALTHSVTASLVLR